MVSGPPPIFIIRHSNSFPFIIGLIHHCHKCIIITTYIFTINSITTFYSHIIFFINNNNNTDNLTNLILALLYNPYFIHTIKFTILSLHQLPILSIVMIISITIVLILAWPLQDFPNNMQGYIPFSVGTSQYYFF